MAQSRRAFLWTAGLGAASLAAASSTEVDHAQTFGTTASRGTMPTRMLGRTGERVSILGLGGFHIGIQHDAEESIRLIRTAIDRGVTFLDNCWDYNDGESHRRMGRALRDGYRDRVFLMTKIDGRTRAAAAGQIDESLRELDVDVIDLLQIHEVIRDTDPERVFAHGGAIEALLEARRAGKVRYLGFTGHKDPRIHLAMLEAARQHGFTFDVVQMPLNVMDAHYRSFQHDVVPVAERLGTGVVSMKPLGGGIFFRSAPLHSHRVSATECLQYAMSLPTSVVITGCESDSILEQALTAATTFEPWTRARREELESRVADVASHGEFERFKTAGGFDGTAIHPDWLERTRR